MKSRTIFSYFLFLSILFLFSCQKQSSTSSGTVSTFIKSIPEGRNLCAVNTFELSDGNYLLIGKDPSDIEPGWIVKFTINGDIIWQKSLSPLVTLLWKGFSLPGTGFMVAGFDNTPVDNKLTIITFDINGNIVSSNTVLPGNGCGNYPIQMIPLSNGGFAFSGSAWDAENYPVPFLLITDNSFNTLYYNVFTPLNQEHKYCITGLTESNNGDINISGFMNLNNVDNAFLLTAYPFAVQESFTWLTNGAVFETPGCVAISSSGTLLLPNASANINAESGQVVNYQNTGISSVSGSIGINRLDTVGNFVSNVQYSGYPNNGLINSINSTQDGGYILCGTVNQLNFQNSNTEIYVLKIDGNLNQQWFNTYDTQYPSYGVSACQATDGGYIISGYHFSFAETTDMVLIKTDADGNVN